MLVYGALVESNRLVVEYITLPLPKWPEALRGYRLALLADMHLRDIYTEKLAERAVAAALAEKPDAYVIPGDVIAYWKPGALAMAEDILAPLRGQNVILTTGNHEYDGGDPEPLLELASSLGFHVLRNEAFFDGQITWVGIESAKVGAHQPGKAMDQACVLPYPRIVVWHEPDMVDELPGSADLMLSGHSHGGQFLFPGGFAPMHTKLGRKYPRGFYSQAPTPLYVSRGLGTTGPPSRLNCPPELSILSLIPG